MDIFHWLLLAVVYALSGTQSILVLLLVGDQMRDRFQKVVLATAFVPLVNSITALIMTFAGVSMWFKLEGENGKEKRGR